MQGWAMEKLTISRQEALRIQWKQRKAKARKHFQLILVHLDAMMKLVHDLPDPYPDTGESGETYDIEMEARRLEATTGPGLSQATQGSGARSTGKENKPK